MLSSENDLAKLTVAELKEKLREAGLKVSGRKAELIERLSAGASPGGATVPSAPAPSAHSPASANPFASMLFPEPQNPTFPPIAIEHCKSWGAFKSRAAKVASGLEQVLTGSNEPVQININADKPRKGVFEVRVGDVIIVTTGPEDRPFPALKALNIDGIVESAADTAKAFYFLG
jgi:hypothetical protein